MVSAENALGMTLDDVIQAETKKRPTARAAKATKAPKAPRAAKAPRATRATKVSSKKLTEKAPTGSIDTAAKLNCSLDDVIKHQAKGPRAARPQVPVPVAKGKRGVKATKTVVRKTRQGPALKKPRSAPASRAVRAAQLTRWLPRRAVAAAPARARATWSNKTDTSSWKGAWSQPKVTLAAPPRGRPRAQEGSWYKAQESQKSQGWEDWQDWRGHSQKQKQDDWGWSSWKPSERSEWSQRSSWGSGSWGSTSSWTDTYRTWDREEESDVVRGSLRGWDAGGESSHAGGKATSWFEAVQAEAEKWSKSKNKVNRGTDREPRARPANRLKAPEVSVVPASAIPAVPAPRRDGTRPGRVRPELKRRRSPERSPEPAGASVQVSNIPPDLNTSDIRHAFEMQAGEVLSCELNTGVARIRFRRFEAARRAVDTFDRGELNGRTIYVEMLRG